MLLAAMDRPPQPDVWAAQFYIRRRNVVAQAVSLYRSVASGFFHSYQASPALRQAFRSVAYDRDALLSWLDQVVACEIDFQSLFNDCGIKPIQLTYEELRANPLGCLRNMADALGIERPVVLPSSSLRVVSDETNSAWEIRLLQEAPQAVEAILHRRPGI